MKLSFVISFFFIPLLVFGVLLFMQSVYGVKIPFVLLITVSLFPFVFIGWIIIRNIIELLKAAWGMESHSSAIDISYQKEGKSWMRYVTIIVAAATMLLVGYFLFVLLRALLPTLSGFRIFL